VQLQAASCWLLLNSCRRIEALDDEHQMGKLATKRQCASHLHATICEGRKSSSHAAGQCTVASQSTNAKHRSWLIELCFAHVDPQPILELLMVP
jgi:hypothetical protein